ncbi:hypothetical protein PBY51_021920 [Eleginops maclovinus]|uniref:Uncharacterized protein n=1 Tax=Eleginops maclovinus TaxID=56733 RepID=A0AAN8ALD1_ELEMC|nr:hypothetical protein PBY51_021920 [Eleginops maclovinus]
MNNGKQDYFFQQLCINYFHLQTPPPVTHSAPHPDSRRSPRDSGLKETEEEEEVLPVEVELQDPCAPVSHSLTDGASPKFPGLSFFSPLPVQELSKLFTSPRTELRTTGTHGEQ